MDEPSMVDATLHGGRLEQLRTLALVIAAQIDDGDDRHSMAQLSRQYRETIREIAEMEGEYDDSDAIADIIADRAER